MKNNKGITLIPLVITIVVLVILGGISIYLVLGENGIISKAKFGSNNYKQAEANEQAQLAKADEYIAGSREQITIDKEEYNALLQKVNGEQLYSTESPSDSFEIEKDISGYSEI